MSNVSWREAAADERKAEEEDSYAWATVKTVIQGDFYEDPTLLGLAIRAGIGVIPGVGQLMDLADTGAWICLAYEKGLKNSEVMLNGAILFIGYVPGVGDLARNVFKGLIGNRAVKELQKLLSQGSYTVRGNVYEAMKKLDADWDSHVKDATEIAKGTLDKLAGLLEELKAFVKAETPWYLKKTAATVTDEIDTFVRFVKELRETTDRMFAEALKGPRETLQKLLKQTPEAKPKIDTKSSAGQVAERADEVKIPPKGEGIEVDPRYIYNKYDITPGNVEAAIESLEAKGLHYGQNFAYVKGADGRNAVEEYVQYLDGGGKPILPWVDENNVILDGHHMATAMEITGKWDDDVIEAAKQGTREAKAAGQLDGWKYKTDGVAPQDVSIMDKDMGIVRGPGADGSAGARVDEYGNWVEQPNEAFTPSQLKQGVEDLDARTNAELKKQIEEMKPPGSSDVPIKDDPYRVQQIEGAEATPNSPKGADGAEKPCVDGDPIDVVSGAVLFDAVDLELPGPLPFLLKRSWNSTHARRLGPLGYGWHHSFDLSLRERANDIRVRIADGRTLKFAPLDKPGHFAFNRGARVKLTRREHDYLLEDSEGLEYTFTSELRLDGAFGLSSIVDRNGNTIRLEYDEGLLTRVRDSAGRVIEFENDEFGFVLAVSVPHPEAAGERLRVVSFERDDNGHVVAIRDAAGKETRYEYDYDHLITKSENRNGVSFHWEYDKSGLWPRCQKSWGDEGILAREFSYDRPHLISHVKDSAGNTTTYYANTVGMPERIVDPLGNETRFEYDKDGLLLAETDAKGHTTRYEYSWNGRLLKTIDKAGNARELGYDDSGQLARLVDEAGNAWTRSVDARGNIVATIAPDGATWRYEHDRRGLVTKIIDPLGRSESIGWDDAGNIARHTSRGGTVTTFKHDALGRMLERHDADGSVTRVRYDALDRIIEVKDAEGRVRRYGYDDEHNVTMAEGADGKKRHFGYGPLDLIEWMREPSGATTRYLYDKELELRAIKDARNRKWIYERDAAGRIVAEVAFDGRRREYGYDATGELVATKDARGNKTRLERDSLGRINKKLFADGREERFAYDALGRLTRAENDAAKIELRYDARGRVIEERLDGHATRYAYDALGNRLSCQSPLGGKVEQSYDVEDRLSSVKRAGLELARYGYDAVGREVERHLPGGVLIKKAYGKTGELVASRTTRGAQVLSGRRYRYDGAGRVQATEDDIFGKVSFEHDVDGRLQAAMYPDQALERFVVDEAGNPAGVPEGPALAADGGCTTRVDDWKLHWDEDGNLIEKQGKEVHYSFEYDAAGRLTQVVRNVRVPESKHSGRRTIDPAQRLVTELAYDPLGRRVRRVERAATGQRDTRFFWDGDRLLGERVESGAEGAVHDVEHVFGAGFEPLASVSAQATWIFECDFRDLPRAAFDAQGELVWQGDFGAFGKTRELRGPDAVPWRFSGQYADSGTELYYNRHRYYDPALRIYTQADPIGLEGGLNTHAYVEDPFTFVDPYGLAKCKPGQTGQLKRNMSSREVVKELKKDGWQEVRSKGDHLQLTHPTKPGTVTVPHPNKDLPIGTMKSISEQSGLPLGR